MGLTGTLPDGTVIQKIEPCEFEGEPVDNGDFSQCEDTPRYRVEFSDGTVCHACEEHAQLLWDAAVVLTMKGMA